MKNNLKLTQPTGVGEHTQCSFVNRRGENKNSKMCLMNVIEPGETGAGNPCCVTKKLTL